MGRIRRIGLITGRFVPLTREGWIWCLGSVALFLTGYLKSINLITLLACFMLAMTGVDFWLARRQIRGLRGKRTVIEPVFADRPCVLLVELENPARGACVGIHVEDSEESKAHWFVGHLPPRKSVQLSAEATLPSRGRHVWGALRVWSGHPLGFVRRQRTLLKGPEVIVLPRPGVLHRGRLRQFLSQASPSTGETRGHPRRHPAAQSEFHGLREFRGGDSPRFIHWRTSARRGELMVREFEDTPNDDLLLIVEPWVPVLREAGTQPMVENLETAMRVAATICWEWCRQKGDQFTLAITRDQPTVLAGTTGANHALRMLEALAVEQGTQVDTTVQLLDSLAETEIGPSPVLVITTHESALPATLALHFHRPVACINVGAAEHRDFCEL